VVLVIIILLSVAGNIFLGGALLDAQKKIQKLEATTQLNAKVLNFASLFITKVLQAQGEISFEDRLKIENAVRDTQDKDIYNEWQKFVGAQTAEEGQQDVKNLLALVISKISQ